jgi:hypothetical protein
MDLGSEHRWTDDGVVCVPVVRAADAKRPPLLLESDRNNVEEEDEGDEIAITPRRCLSRFCPCCCVGRGLELRRRLIRVLETKYECVQMWTLTIDPKLFASAKEAHEYVRRHRCVSEWVRSLRVGGRLISGDYICVVEWQKETEMPHFHVLLNARFIPYEVALGRWGNFRPTDAGPVEGRRPAFGTVLFSEGNFKSKRHAAHYASKYLTKHPEHGYPLWVRLSKGEFKRYQTSKGFWSVDGDAEESREDERDEKKASTENAHRELRTIEERVAACGKETVVLKVVEEKAGDEKRPRYSYVRNLDVPYDEALRILGLPAQRGTVRVSRSQLIALGIESRSRVIEVDAWDFGEPPEQEDRDVKSGGQAA